MKGGFFAIMIEMVAAILIIFSIAADSAATNINVTSGQNECSLKPSYPFPLPNDCTGAGLKYRSATDCTCECIDQVYSMAYYYVNVNATRRIVVCGLLTGEVCLLDNTNPKYQPCISTATCIAINSTHGNCKCNLGLTPNGVGGCVGLYGSKCNILGGNVPAVEYRECFAEGNLICDIQSKTCVCPSPKLTQENGICVAPAGQQCRFRTTGLAKEIPCAKGLTCTLVVQGSSYACKA